MAEKLYDIFISYSSKDQKLVEAMCHYLEERNLRCFVAYRDIPKGKDWAPYIEKGFEDSKVLVYVHTESSNKSIETTREINLAFEEGCVVIPFRVNSIKYGEGKRYRLNNVNWLDAFPGNPENYFGDLFDILKVNFPERIQQKEDEQARLDAEKAEAERIAREKAEAEERRREAERRERERRQREEEARRRREERERRKEEFKTWWKKNQSKVWGILATVAFIWIMIIAVDSCDGATETATETAAETTAIEQNVIEVVETPATEIQEEPWINEEEEQRQAEIERQKAQQEKKKQDEENKFNEYKKKGDENNKQYWETGKDVYYKNEAIFYYKKALKIKYDSQIEARLYVLENEWE